MNRIFIAIIFLTILAYSCNNPNANKDSNQVITDSLEIVDDFVEYDTLFNVIQIGAKFTLKLNKISDKKYKYEVVDFQEIDYCIDYSKTDTLFSKSPELGTIECYFARGIDQSGPFKSVLILRNNTKEIINYEALISYQGKDEFFNTNVSSLYPNVKASELWNDNLTAIIIKNLTIN